MQPMSNQTWIKMRHNKPCWEFADEDEELDEDKLGDVEDES
jgi:hypothetical protein